MTRLRSGENPLFWIRARGHKTPALEIHPLVKTSILGAPSEKVRRYLVGLRARANSLLEIPAGTAIAEGAVPALAAFAGLRMRIPRHKRSTAFHS